MAKFDFNTYVNGIKEDIKISIDDLFYVIEVIRDDIEALKTQINNQTGHGI